jgi:hypothetical protein
MSDLRPWNIMNLIAGASRVVLAPTTEDVAESIQDVVAMVKPYALAGTYFDLGAGTEANEYSRSFESEGLEIQQETGDVMTDITDVGRTMSVSMAEFDPDHVKVIEEAQTVETIAAGAGTSAQQAVPIGSFEDLTPYRAVLLGVRKKPSGIVEEPDGTERGRLLGVALNRVTLAAEEASMAWEKGSLVAANVVFESFPESGLPSDEAYGRWLFEDAGVIAAV